MYSMTVNYDFGWAVLTSATSYLDNTTSWPRDGQDFVGGALGTAPNNSIWVIPVVNDYEQNDLNQEFRLASSGDSALEWVVGVYYADQELDYDVRLDSPGFTNTVETLFGIPFDVFLGAPGSGLDTTFFNFPGDLTVDRLFDGVVTTEQEQLAVFGELTYHITDKFDILVGLRWSDWDQDYRQHYSGFFNGGVTLIDESQDDNALTYKVALSYQLNDDIKLYASTSTGFRFGGVNDILPGFCGITGAETFGSDEVDNYEIGIKSAWMGNRVRANATVYFTEYKDAQTPVLVPVCGFVFKNNQGEQESIGLELELEAAVTENLLLSFSGAYIDSEIKRDNPSAGSAAGDPAPLVPEFSFSLSGEYNRQLTDNMDGFVRMSYQYVDDRADVYTEARNFDLESYSLLNLRTGIITGDWTITAYVDNLTDEQEITHNTMIGGVINSSVLRPRSFGFTINREF